MAETENTLSHSSDVFQLRDDLVELLIDNLSIDGDMVSEIKGYDQAAEAIIKFFSDRLATIIDRAK